MMQWIWISGHMGVELRKAGIAIGTSCTHAFMEGRQGESQKDGENKREGKRERVSERHESHVFDVTISLRSLISCF